jgi:predicted 2-oxoglutarate/Fe(II)-dependent dioxygenase YbiX
MTAVARNRLAGVLGAAAAPAASSVRMRAKPDDLHLTVKGVGRVRLPVPPKQASQLCRLGRKARFGRGEETLTDPEVRDTWEIPKSLVRIEWSDTFAAILESVRDELGLAAHCELAADFHSMLVYEPGQFFVPHQDSEKDDTMVGTLVVTLPSTYTGGALVIDDGGEAVTYRGSKVALTLVAFYADCRHEVRPVTSGYRITLTYNLLLRGDASKPLTGEDDATVSEVASCLDQYFTTRAARLVYLLDHEYTARGLSWSRLKGADAHRSALLRAAADRSACETVLALADIQETWSAYESEPEYGYRGRDRYWDDFEDDDHEGGRSGEYELEELIESSVRLLHWTRQAGTGVEDISLTVDDAEVCATTPSTDVQPYASQYEGYMGNYGNTMDRWYRRAALVVWPHDQAFRNRAEAAPAWALDELGAWVRANDLAGARAAATTLEPIWDTAARTGQSAGFLGKGLRTARALDDAELAEMLLRPFRVESLSPIHAPPLARLAARHGGHWMDQLLRTWFGDRGPWPYAGGQDRSAWLASLPRLCKALHAKGDPGTDTAHRLLDLSWGWLGQSVRQGIATQPPSYRDQRLSELGRPLAAVLTAAGQTGAVKLRDGVIEFGRQQRDEVIVCVMPALRTARTLPADTWRDGGFDDLAADCVTRLRARLAHPSRADDDWSIHVPDGCACALCGTLGAFLRDRSQRTFEWPLAKEGRRHVHSRIDAAELPVRHETRRAGRPYTLILTKSPDLFAREEQARKRDEADLEWLIGHR